MLLSRAFFTLKCPRQTGLSGVHFKKKMQSFYYKGSHKGFLCDPTKSNSMIIKNFDKRS